MNVIDALKYLPENINAAKSSPLAFICLLMSLAFLLSLAFFLKASTKVQLGVVAGFMVSGLLGLTIANSHRVEAANQDAKATPVQPATSVKPSGKVVDDMDQPIKGARVSIEPGSQPTQVLTDDYGRFEFSSFDPGASPAKLNVHHDGYANFSMNYDLKSAAVFQTVMLNRAPGKPGPAPSSGTITLTGDVSDQDRHPIAGATVIAESGGPSPQHRQTTTANNGHYIIPGFHPQPGAVISIKVSAPGYAPYENQITNDDVGLQQIQLTRAQ